MTIHKESNEEFVGHKRVNMRSKVHDDAIHSIVCIPNKYNDAVMPFPIIRRRFFKV